MIHLRFSVYGNIISWKNRFVKSFLKKFFFFWKKPIDKLIFLCYNTLARVPKMDFVRWIMNTYFDRNEQINSNKRIMDAYFGERARCASRPSRAIEAVLSLLLRLWQLLTCATARRIARAASVAVSLVALVGVVGAIERGTLGVVAGLLLGVAVIAVEYLCLAHRRA
jgi:hypothetical protein